MASIPTSPTRLELLQLDIDLRIYAVLLEAGQDAVLDEYVAALMRLAYGAGYCDALQEPHRGQLCEEHGFPVPERTSAQQIAKRRS